MVHIVSVFLAPLQKLLSTLQSERHYQDDKKDEALQAIQIALIQTKKYIEEFGGEKCADRKTEYGLSQLWAEASVKARHASSELAIRLNDKSKLWQATIEWSSEEVLHKQIDFESIEATLADMLVKTK